MKSELPSFLEIAKVAPIDRLTRQSSPQEAYAVANHRYFNPTDMLNYLAQPNVITSLIAKGYSDDPREVQQTLAAFITSDYFIEPFASYQWFHETNPDWGDRDVNVALWEAIAHTFTIVNMRAQNDLYYDGRKHYPDLSEDDILALKNNSSLGLNYFNRISRNY